LGYLIPPSPGTGAKILEEILGHQINFNEVGKRGREEVLGCCSWDSVIGGLEKVYRYQL
jgi:hypothetical protein